MSHDQNLLTWEQTKSQLSKFENPFMMIESDLVKDRFIKNYELASKKKDGILAYQAQVISFRQCIANNSELAKCSVESLYKCFIQASIKGYSLDVADQQCYLYPYGTVATLQPQAGAFVEKLKRNRQILYSDQAKLVYKGDVIEVENGKVTKHIEKFASEEIILGYVRFVRVDNSEIYFIYRPSDWLAWRSKSKQKTSENWTGGANSQPMAAFLRTKIVLHAAKEKIWSPSNTPVFFERYDEIEIDEVLIEEQEAAQFVDPQTNNFDNVTNYEEVITTTPAEEPIF